MRDIDDSVVLAFWLARGVDEDAEDFRGYRTTWRGFLRLIRVLAEASVLESIESPAHLDAVVDRTVGAVAAAPDAVDPFEALLEPPAAQVKALTKRQLRLLAVPVGDPAGVAHLPLSYLRAVVFGAVQNRLSQALRRRAAGDEIAGLVAAGARADYGGHLAALEEAAEHVRHVSRACLYVLRRQTRGAGNRAVDVEGLAEARAAFKALNRTGFDGGALSDPDRRAAFVALADILPDIADRLRVSQRALEACDWRAAEADDGMVFSEAFGRLYGTSV